jgi:glyoxylase-like metal-dependent hydrolase (beta-lactamase superfamily II)
MKSESRYKVHPIVNTGFSRTYIIEEHSSLMAVDVGSIGAAGDIEEYITGKLGRSLSDLQYITATHFHIDHIGGIGHLVGKCSSTTKILFNYKVADYLSRKKKISLIRHWFSGLVPASVASARYVRRFSHLGFESLAGIPIPGFRNFVGLPFKKERICYFGGNGNRRYKLGFEKWEVIETPGHTEDSVSFFNEETGELICGDLIINISKGGRGSLNHFCWNGDIIQNSFKYLCDTTMPSVIYPGHGDIIVRDNGNALTGVKAF